MWSMRPTPLRQPTPSEKRSSAPWISFHHPNLAPAQPKVPIGYGASNSFPPLAKDTWAMSKKFVKLNGSVYNVNQIKSISYRCIIEAGEDAKRMLETA